MTRRLRLVPLALAALLAAGLATAQSPDEVFARLDRNGDGSLSKEEFATGWQRMQQLAQARGRLQAQFASVDTDGDGGLDASEYAKLLLVRRAGTAAPPFASFDSDGDDRLDFSEYAALVRSLAPKTAEAGPER